MAYLIADGFNRALASLVAIDPQPQGDPVAPVFRGYAASGVVHEQGEFCVWNWSSLEDEAQYLSVLTQLGLHNTVTNEKTIYTRNKRMLWARYNAIVTLPEMGVDARWADYFPRQIVVRFTRLVAIEQDAAAAITLGAVTVAATGTVAIASTASITLGATTVEATGTVV